jgi:hypothetical protein
VDLVGDVVAWLKAKPRMVWKVFFEEVVEGVVADLVEGASSVVT